MFGMERNNQYPDEDEEFEMQYADDLQMLNELHSDDEEFVVDDESAGNEKCKAKLMGSNLWHLSQVSFGDDLSEITSQVADGRRQFSTPRSQLQLNAVPVPQPRDGPYHGALRFQLHRFPHTEPLSDDEDDDAPQTSIPQKAIVFDLQNASKKRKLTVSDVIGDISYLYGDYTYEDPAAKKAKTEDERDREAIAKILEIRKSLRQHSKSVQTDSLTRLGALKEFKLRNLSSTLPKWPFMPLRRNNGERIYIRFHSEEYETKAINDAVKTKSNFNLLGADKEKIWREANELMTKSFFATASAEQQRYTAAAADFVAVPKSNEDDDDVLWVEKYKPRKYIDLLSDEMTNRSLLFWLRMWDRVVFGREFNGLQASDPAKQMNTFNKRTGKFESNGGWQSRKVKKNLNINVDDLGRPMQKVALLCGPPGMGKTTLAHTLARHAGYNVREINASDDRSPEAFQLALENGTQMSGVMNEGKRPNCIILDEIDGAPRQSIEFLVKFATDSVSVKKPKKSGKVKHNVLKRPIICICNDLYEPALRPLRQIALVVVFPPIDAALLAERLSMICKEENLFTDFGALLALAEKSACDVRSCISTMQFFSCKKKCLKMSDVLNTSVGQKDQNKGLFDVWNTIFRIQRPLKHLTLAQNIMSDMSLQTRASNVLQVVHSSSDYERLTQGVYENYLQQKMPDSNLNAVVDACQWFSFIDQLQHHINHYQNYTVYPYLQYGFVKWNFLFASFAWPNLNFPHKHYEFNQKCNTQKSIFQALCKGGANGAMGIGQGVKILLETVPLLKRVLSPQIRPVAVQLLTIKERNDLEHTVAVMADLGLNYHQVKTQEGSIVYRMEPDLDVLAQFSGSNGLTVTHFGRQLLARQIELENVQRAVPKKGDFSKSSNKASSSTSSKKVPNHLQRLQFQQPKNMKKTKMETTSKDSDANKIDEDKKKENFIIKDIENTI